MADETTIKFGLAEYKDKITGIVITSIDWNKNGQKAEAMNEDGDVIQTDRYGRSRSITVNGNVRGTSDEALEPGGTITIDGRTYGIDSVNVKRGNTAHKTVTITASAPWDNEDPASAT